MRGDATQRAEEVLMKSRAAESGRYSRLRLATPDCTQYRIGRTACNNSLAQCERRKREEAWCCTGYSQKNVAVSKVNNKFISHLTRTHRTPSAAATVQFLMR
jgi:hypothetical protein